MRTVRETISGGISTLAQLQEALQLATQLEFSTIPPYLCAEWSINTANNGDPSSVAGLIHGIVIQEMYHLGLASNMLTAIGGKPTFTQPSFVPTYPTNGLPGGVWKGLVVDLVPLSYTSLLSFMQIEFPEDALIAVAPDSIGAFYDTISAGFQTVNPTFIQGAPQVVTQLDDDNLTAIANQTQALAAITTIKEQGEGTTTSPDETSPDTGLAHYYTFSEVYYGAQLVKNGDIFTYTGNPITFPTVFPFKGGTATDDFNSIFLKLMAQLQTSWTTDPNTINDAIDTMFTLQSSGVDLIKKGIQPQFVFPTVKKGRS
jgi:rubrerythrin